MTYEELTEATREARAEWESLARTAREIKDKAIDFQKSSTDGYKGLESSMAQINAHLEDEKAMWRDYYAAQSVADEADKKWKELARARKEMKA